MRNNVKSATEHVSVRNRENAVAYAEAIASQVFDIIVSGGKNPNRIAMLLNKHGVATPAGAVAPGNGRTFARTAGSGVF